MDEKKGIIYLPDGYSMMCIKVKDLNAIQNMIYIGIIQNKAKHFISEITNFLQTCPDYEEIASGWFRSDRVIRHFLSVTSEL